MNDSPPHGRIAILGWGSLIWCPRELALAGKWRADGPCLPIEFARKSGGDRVTLVIMPPDYPVLPTRTYWAESAVDNLNDARENLWIREGKPKRRFIHYAVVTDQAAAGSWGPNYEGGGPNDEVAKLVVTWLRDSGHDLDAAIWTGLPPQGFDHRDPERLTADVLVWLLSLARNGDDRVRAAREYVESAPATVATPLRVAMEDAPLSWQRSPLGGHLFDGSPVGPDCLPWGIQSTDTRLR